MNRYEWFIANNSDFANSFVLFEKDVNGYVFTEPGMYCLESKVTNREGNEDICNYSAYACFQIAESELYVPNTFTPNGDGSNDEFKVAFASVASFRCRIYTRYGRKVYDSEDISEGWDGKIGDSNAPVGVYFYVIEAKGTNGENLNKRGNVNLLRKKDD